MYFDRKGQKGITLRFTLRSNLSRFERTLWSYLWWQRSNVNELVKGHKERGNKRVTRRVSDFLPRWDFSRYCHLHHRRHFPIIGIVNSMHICF